MIVTVLKQECYSSATNSPRANCRVSSVPGKDRILGSNGDETEFISSLFLALSVHSYDRQVLLLEPNGSGNTEVRIRFEGIPIGVNLAKMGPKFHVCCNTKKSTNINGLP